MDRIAPPSLDQLLSIKAEELTTLIDVGVVIEGVLHVTNGRSVLISGEVRGAIESNGSVVINEGATVIGSIRAKSLQVSGSVRAAKETDVVDIEGPIVLTKSAVVACDAVSDGVQTEFGAVMNGRFRPREERPQASGLGAIPAMLRKDAEGFGARPAAAPATVLQAVSSAQRSDAAPEQGRQVG